MKRCLKCNRVYDDDTLRFCLEDGTLLSGATSQSEAPPTEILPQRVAPTMKPSGPTIPSYLSADPARSDPGAARRSNPILTVGVVAIVLLLLALVGIAGYFVFRQSVAYEASKTNNNVPEVPAKKSSPASTDPARNPSPETSMERTAPGSQTGTP